jgi:hypothetical protein
MFGAIDRLLRDRDGVLARVRAGEDLPGLARAMLLTILAGGAMFGATLGAFRGGLQIPFAAVKLPAVMLFTAALCAPALTALKSALGRPADLGRDLVLVLASLAIGSLVIAALAPLVLLLVTMRAPYHHAILTITGCCALGGTFGLALLVRGLGAGHRLIATALVVVFLAVGSQMAWTLRPYLERPRTPDIVFVRGVEGSLIESVVQTAATEREERP